MSETLRPFWRYFGGKWRLAPYYPPPQHEFIVEPFAGAAGYSMWYPQHRVVLVDKYEVIVEVWRYLIRTPASEILAIPVVDAVDDLPAWVPQAARYLVGFCLSNMSTTPRKTISAGVKKARDHGGYAIGGWGARQRDRVASQVDQIRHWIVIQGDYHTVDLGVPATWFIDPPYQLAGKAYKHSSLSLDFEALGTWCRSRRGQVIVCENEGATWLPFQRFRELNTAMSKKKSVEAIWYNECA